MCHAITTVETGWGYLITPAGWGAEKRKKGCGEEKKGVRRREKRGAEKRKKGCGEEEMGCGEEKRVYFGATVVLCLSSA